MTMNYLPYLLATLAAFSMNAYALQSRIELYEQFDNLRVVAFVDETDIDQSPAWSPSVSSIPLTVADALQAVVTFKKDAAALEKLKEIEIRQVPNHEGHWHYLIKIADDEMKTRYAIYVVLMNGKVIPAIIEPRAYGLQ